MEFLKNLFSLILIIILQYLITLPLPDQSTKLLTLLFVIFDFMLLLLILDPPKNYDN